MKESKVREQQNFYVTFGGKYRTEEHGSLGRVPDLPEQWVRIEAHDDVAARCLAWAFLEEEWSSMYFESTFEQEKHLYPKGEYGVIRAMEKRFGFELVREEVKAGG